MMKMGDIVDMRKFGEAMNALSVDQSAAAADESHPSKNIAAANEDDDNGGGGGFIDSSDHGVNDDGDGDESEFAEALSCSPDSVALVPSPLDAKKSATGGMRRVMSMASLPLSRNFSLPAVAQDMNTICEEGDHQVDDAPHVDDAPKKEKLAFKALNGSTNSRNSRRPARRLISSSFTAGMPLRSSLKGSASNLRASLGSRNSGSRSNLRSRPSSASMASSMDDTNHSFDSKRNSEDDEADESLTSSKMNRNVSFSSLEIRSYGMTLGDAPTSNGPPVTLDWKHDPTATEECTVDEYERYRDESTPRRTKREMLMPPMHRQHLLMREMGISRGEVREAMEEAKRTAKRRERTARSARLGFVMPVEAALERVTKRGVLLFGKKKKMQSDVTFVMGKGGVEQCYDDRPGFCFILAYVGKMILLFRFWFLK